MRRRSAGGLAGIALASIAGCGLLGGGQITVTARNATDQEMVVQVIDAAEAPYGESVTVSAGEERDVTVAVPGGDWTVSVNGARLLTSSDAGSRRGELPVTLVLPDPEEFAHGPFWEAPSDWAGAGP
jgi:hypothetical protein